MADSDNNNQQPEKKATEILSELNDKVDHLTKIVSVYDQNSKITLDRVNNIYKFLEKLITLAEKDNKIVKDLPANTVSIKKGQDIAISNEPQGARKISRQEMIAQPEQSPLLINNFPEYEEPKKQQKIASKDVRGVPVTQTVKWNDGKDVFMAKVEIYNNNEIFANSKTNAVGKWSALLPPGDYKIKIIKANPNNKEEIYTLEEELNIPDNSFPIKLANAVMK